MEPVQAQLVLRIGSVRDLDLLLLDLVDEVLLRLENDVVAAEQQVRLVAADEHLEPRVVAHRAGHDHRVLSLELGGEEHLVVVLHVLEHVVSAAAGHAHGPASVDRPQHRRHHVRQEIADDAGRPRPVAAPAVVDVRVEGVLALRAAPGFPVEHLAGDDLGLDLVEPLAVLRVAAIARLRERRMADLAGRDELLRLAVLGVHHVLRADLQDLLVGVDHATQVQRVLDPHRQGLLDVDVLARHDRVDRHRHVPVLGRGDEHGVDVLARQELVVVAIGRDIDLLLLAALLLRRVEPRLAHVGQRDHLHLLATLLVGVHDPVEVAVAHAARPDETHANRISAGERRAFLCLRFRRTPRAPRAEHDRCIRIGDGARRRRASSDGGSARDRRRLHQEVAARGG